MYNLKTSYKNRYLILIVILMGMNKSPGATSILERANDLYSKGKYEASIPLYKQAVDKGENPALCYFNCANAFFQIDSIPQSIVYYRACLSYAPDFFRGYLNLSIAYYTLNDIGECIAVLTRAREIEPENVKASMVLAESFRQAGANKEAGALFERILEEHPEKEDIYIALGEIYRELDDHEEAIHWLSQYPSTGKNLEYVLLLLSDIYQSRNDMEKNLYYLQKVFEKNPTKRWVFYRIVMLLQKMGNEFLAFEEAKKGLELFPDFAELAVLAGNSAFKQEMYSQAEHYYNIAKENGSPAALVGLENIRIIKLEKDKENLK